MKDLSVLVDWCQRRGLQVIFAKHENGTYDECEGTITIAANASIEKQVFYLFKDCIFRRRCNYAYILKDFFMLPGGFCADGFKFFSHMLNIFFNFV